MSVMTATRMVRVATIVAAAAAWGVAATLLWQTDVPGGLELPRLDASAEFGARHLEETSDYARFHRVNWVLSTLAQLAVLVGLCVRTPRLRGGRVVRGAGLLLAALAALWLVRLPFGLAGHWWRRRHGISRQDYLGWLVSPWLELLATVAAALVAVVVAMLLARRLGGRWWIAATPLLVVLGSVVVLGGPLVEAQRLEPLRDDALTAEVGRLARETGVGEVEVEVEDASERTTRANAEVVGLGPTKRVVLWDTLLDGRFTDGEIRFVIAHELAHVGRNHLWKGMAWFALLAPLVLLVVARSADLSRAEAVPRAVLAVVAVQLALLPLAGAVSRRYEAEADWVALEATREPAAAESLLRRFSHTALAEPEPPTWSYALRSTHPSLLERIAMARAWAFPSRRAEPSAAAISRQDDAHSARSFRDAAPRPGP
jgi:STE24 endopeptidase